MNAGIRPHVHKINQVVSILVDQLLGLLRMDTSISSFPISPLKSKVITTAIDTVTVHHHLVVRGYQSDLLIGLCRVILLLVRL